MATREQVAFRLREYERRESHLNDEGMITLGTLRLALRALDTERDAALGRAVRGVVDRGEHTIDVLDGAIVGLVPTLGPEVVRVVLAHLREEQKGAP